MGVNRSAVLVIHPEETQFVRISAHKRDPDLLLFYLGEKLIGILQVSDATDRQCKLLKQLLAGMDAKVVVFPDRIQATAPQIKEICETFDIGVRVN